MRVLIVCLFFILFPARATALFTPYEDTVYPATRALKVYHVEPSRPYAVIGQVVAIGSGTTTQSEEELFKMLKRKAMARGAHAIMKVTITSMSFDMAVVPTIKQVTHKLRIRALAIRFTQREDEQGN